MVATLKTRTRIVALLYIIIGCYGVFTILFQSRFLTNITLLPDEISRHGLSSLAGSMLVSLLVWSALIAGWIGVLRRKQWCWIIILVSGLLSVIYHIYSFIKSFQIGIYTTPDITILSCVLAVCIGIITMIALPLWILLTDPSVRGNSIEKITPD